jgi:hypothetical protein
MTEAAQQSDDWRDIQPAETQSSPYTHGDDWHDIAPPASLDEFAGPKITGTPLYKAGEAVQKFGRETFPVSEEERAAHPYASAIGRGVGSMLPAAVGTLVAGPAGALAGAAQMGMSSGADVFDDALSKGATEEQAAKAAGATGALSAAIGVLPLGAILAPIRQKLPGMAGWAVAKLTQAAVNGVTFATVGEAQQWLTTEVEKAYYDPNAHYDPQLKDMLASFVVGGAFGTMHPLHRPGEAPGQPAEAVLPPERGPLPAGLGAREAPIIEGEPVWAPAAAEGRPEGVPSPARALPPPAETAPAATRESLKETLDRNAPLDELVQHPYVRHVDEQNKKAVPTGTAEDFANPEWRSQRVYDFNVKEFGTAATTEPVQGWDAAVERLTDRAKLYAGPEGVENGKHAIIVVGPPASGKSSTSEPLARAFRAAIVDSDDAKLVIPEYRGGLGTQAVHEESSYMAKDVLGRLIDDEANIVVPKVGQNADATGRQISRLKELGYKVDLVHVAATPEISGRRNIERLYKIGRLVPPEFIADLGDKPRETYHLLKGEADGFADIDTTTRPGETREASPGLANVLPDGRNIRHDYAASAGRGAKAQAGSREEAQVGQIGPHRVTAADGTAIDVAPRVVEAGRVLTSQDQGYDPTLQPRQRNRAASQAQVRDIATNLDPERLGYSAEADRGAPIIGPDGMVESGNGRVLALRHVYDQNAPQAQAYRDWLSRQGVDVSKFRNPILVRQRTTPFTPEQRRAFTVAANQPTTLAMSASERAMADARLIDTNSLNLIVNPDDLSRNHDFVRRFVGQLPQTEQGAMTDAHGALSSEGSARVRNAVLAKAYGDAGILTRVAESTDDEIKSISNALVGAAPRWAKMRAGIESGAVRRDVEATPDLLEAVKRTADIRAKGQKFNEYLAQIDAFDKLPDTVEGFMRSFYDPKGRRAASAERIRDALRFYADEASKVSADKGLDLGLVKVEPRDILRLAQKKGWEGLPIGRPEEPDAGKMLSVANKVASEWQEKLGPDIKVVMGGSLVSRTYVRSRGDEPIDMDIRFLTDNPERDYPKVEAVTGLKLKKSRPMDNYPSGSAIGYLVEGPLTRDGITFDVEAAVRTPAYVGWARFYPAVMTPDELAAFRADKARLKGDKEAYKALKASTLKEVVKRVEDRGGPWELERELYGRQGRDANRDGAGTGAGQPAGGAEAPGPFLTAGGEGFGREGAEGDQEAAVRAQRPERPRDLIAEREREGQLGLPGAERITTAQLAQRRANEPLRPRVAQEPPSGLFAHQGQQLSLEDFIDHVSDVKAQRPEAQTDTPEFKRWFGDSKVVDQEGKPLVLYKGMWPYDWTKETSTDRGPLVKSINRTTEFPAFNPRDPNELGIKIAGFFGDAATANRFAPKEGAVYPVFLKIEKPLVIDAAGQSAGTIQFGETGRPFRDAVRSGKYDGVIIKNTADEGDVYVALKPEQIKSAIGNRGTFDEMNPDITSRVPTGWESAEGHAEPQGQKIRIGRNTYAYVNPKYSAKEQEIANAVMEIGARMAPKANIKGVAALRQSDSPIWGGFINSAAFPQLITWSLEKGGAGQIGQTVRHEIIHHLRNMGLFSPDEWKALRDAAVHDGWLQRHNIYERYPDLSADHKVEEAVAEQFGKWRAERSLVKPGPIRNAFMRLELFLRRVAAAVRKAMGFNATPADIFTRIETGEIGNRSNARSVPNMPEALAQMAEESGAKVITAYHGSPHDFDAFDISKIGTGEGAQAYGHGLYFAENEGTAEQYKKAFDARSGAEQDAKMYQVSINADPEHFLDWDKPLSEQSPKVQEALRPLVPAKGRYNPEPNYDLTGEELLQHMEIENHQHGQGHLDRAAASDALRAAGVPGIKYLDQGSRAQAFKVDLSTSKGPYSSQTFPTMTQAQKYATDKEAEGFKTNVTDQGTRNYVVFDDKLINIIKKRQIGGRVKRASGGRVDTRKASHYSPTRGTDARHCSNCTMFRRPHACTAVSGFIAKPGLCDWYEGGKEKTENYAAPKIDTSHDVRWLSEMSKSGNVYYRDRSLPKQILNNGKWLPIDEPLKRHEVAEFNAIKKMIEEFEQKHGRKPNDAEREVIYLKCHKEHGEVAEHAYLRENGYDVKAWESWCRGKLAHLEHKRIAKPVPNPHVRPSPHDRRRLEATL